MHKPLMAGVGAAEITPAVLDDDSLDGLVAPSHQAAQDAYGATDRHAAIHPDRAPALLLKGSKMCQPKRCSVCGKTTWSGCGMHVDAVKAAVPADQWCEGHPKSDRPSRMKFWR